jgi:hypothetical protein
VKKCKENYCKHFRSTYGSNLAWCGRKQPRVQQRGTMICDFRDKNEFFKIYVYNSNKAKVYKG